MIGQATKKLDAAREPAEAEVRAVREGNMAPRRSVSAVSTILDGEVRTRMTAIPADARRAALSKALRVGDDAVVGAALADPAMPTGFADRAEQEEFRRQ